MAQKARRRHRKTFKQAEIDELRRLVREKETADQPRQKQLRGEMRGIGFYISDFGHFGLEGFKVEDLDDLIDEGRVKIRS